MVKSGLIMGLVSLFFAVGAAVLSPVCVPCVAVLLGILAGILGGVFDQPARGRDTTKTGAYAGGISGVGALLGQIAGAFINAALVGPEGAADILSSLGYQTGNLSSFSSSYWLGVIFSTLCFGILDIVLMGGFGALGAVIWDRVFRKDKNQIGAAA